MSAVPAIHTRPMADADVPAVVRLLDEALGPAPGGADRRELFEWKHLRNPFGRSIALVAESGEGIVGLRCFMRWRLAGAGGVRALAAVRAVDTATSPAMQRHGVFSQLTREALAACEAEGVSLVFNTPNDRSRPGYLKLGWRVVGVWPLWVRARRPGRLAVAALRRDLRSGPGVATPTGSSLVPAEEALRRSEERFRLAFDNAGPIARTSTVASGPPTGPIMTPPIITLSPVPTKPRVLMLANSAVADGSSKS